MNNASLQRPRPSSAGSSHRPAELSLLIDRIAPSSSPTTRRALLDAARVRTFARDDVLVAQGERSTVGVVIDGVVAARRTTRDGRAVVPLILCGGSVLGYLVLADQEALFDFVGLAPGTAALWAGSHVRSLAAGDAGLALSLLDHTLGRLAQLTVRLDSFHYQDARGRVARVLIQYADLCFGPDPLVARNELSLFMGTSREMTRRVLSRIEGEGIIRRVGRTGLELRDPDRLRRLAGLEPASAWAPDAVGR